MRYKVSSIKTFAEGFNNCPDRQIIKNLLGGIRYEAVDLTDGAYCSNDQATLVIKANKSEAVHLLQTVYAMNADELNVWEDRDNLFLRFWWD